MEQPFSPCVVVSPGTLACNAVQHSTRYPESRNGCLVVFPWTYGYPCPLPITCPPNGHITRHVSHIEEQRGSNDDKTTIMLPRAPSVASMEEQGLLDGKPRKLQEVHFEQMY